MSEKKELFFYFDFSSPFAYLGATQIEAVAARTGGVVRYRPFLLGGLFRDLGTSNVPLFTMPEAKRRHALADLARWASLYGEPILFPTRFPMNTVKPLRIVLSRPEDERQRIVLPLFRAYWAEDRDISEDTVLADVAEAVGLDPTVAITATKADAMKTALKEATDAARQIGICGAPSFLVDNLLFWGQDRLVFVEKALNGWRPENPARNAKKRG